MIIQDGVPHFHLGLVLLMCLLGGGVTWVALKMQSWRMDLLFPIQLLFIVYRLEDLNPHTGGCTLQQIQNTAGGLVGALFSRWQIQSAMTDLTRLKAVTFDAERETYSLAPSGDTSSSTASRSNNLLDHRPQTMATPPEHNARKGRRLPSSPPGVRRI